ncbi:thermonuclease family protein [Actinoallomurus rhizosphaericola]|uniref:thermonuclease family protein n=1 Tax=Actinoallomurus rhizosphaericola TaxID=2952536 RepID=UPI0020938954|nr:thermonuclease family protein [Actinoallomurus rhizosphaericola]MCO5996109.1 thermonuclease family protein [Actinoallomurus rhizosphaericola]
MWRWALVGAGLLAAVCAVHAAGGPAIPWNDRRPPEAAAERGGGEKAGAKAVGAEAAGDEAIGGGGNGDGGRGARGVGNGDGVGMGGGRGGHVGGGNGDEGGGGGPGPPHDARSARVVRVVDGDTLLLRIDGRSRRVRLIGVDAPETWARHDCFGAEATRALRRLTPAGAEVRVAGDRAPDDRFGRLLLHLWTSRGGLVAASLVRNGFARALVVPPDTRYAAVLGAAEAAARRAGVGLWGACH